MTSRPFDASGIPANLPPFPNWRDACDRAKAAAVAQRSSGAPHVFDESVWQAFKPYLKRHFLNRCAYCEWPIIRDYGHVEHYRPKRRVDDEPSHLGYYWCAYDPSNLLLSCAMCNAGDSKSGKKNLFPVRPGTRAYAESQMSAEEPVLLNPYVDKVADHFAFGFHKRTGRPTGWILGLTDRAKISMNVYGLNRPEIRDERLEAQTSTIQQWPSPAHRKLLREGRLSFPAARWAAIRNFYDVTTR